MQKYCLLILCCLLISACGNLVDKRIAELRSLTEKVECRGERFTAKEWKEVYVQYNQLIADFDDLELNEMQADTIYYLKQHFRKACIHSSKEATGNVISEVATDIVDEFVDICDPATEYVKDSVLVIEK